MCGLRLLLLFSAVFIQPSIAANCACENGHECTPLGCVCSANNYKKCNAGLECDPRAGCVDPRTMCGSRYCSAFETCRNSACHCGTSGICSDTKVCFNNHCYCGSTVCNKPGETCVDGECRCGLRKCDEDEQCALFGGAYQCTCGTGSSETICKADSVCMGGECKCEKGEGVTEKCPSGTICVDHECITATGFADEICDGGAIDLVFVIDESGSVGLADFALALEAAVDFAELLDIGTGIQKSRVGLVTFDSSARVRFQLDTYHTNANVAAAIRQATYGGWGTNIREGMRIARIQVLNNTRPVPRIMLLMTDGDDATDVGAEHDLAALEGIVIYAIGITDSVDRNQLIRATGDESKVYMINDFSGLKGIVNQVCPQIGSCYDVEKFCPVQIASCATPLVLSYMKKNCRRTCGYCKCADDPTLPPNECANMAYLCYDNSYMPLMTQLCGSTCELCETKCKDVLDCSNYLTICLDTDLSVRTFMGKNCRKSCRYCTVSPNDNDHCVDVDRTFCEANPVVCYNPIFSALASVQCPKTCSKC